MRRSAAVVLLVVVLAGAMGAAWLASPSSARGGILGLGGLASGACKVLGTVGEGWWGKACSGAVDVGGKLVGGGKKAVKAIGAVADNPVVQRAAALAAIVAWVVGGAKWTMDHMASVISSTTSPTLTAAWFTSVYLRVEAIALFFTLVFLCAAAAEALLRSDATLLARAVFVQLPLSALLTSVAAPLTMLLLAASDELSGGVARVAGEGTTHFLTGTSAWVGAGLTVADPFFAVMAGGLVVAAGAVLWVELLVREIAVYVVVAMLPLVFAAMVWPARRVWATRTIEVLVALILSKVAIVVVLALGGAALDHAGVGGISKLLGGLALLGLGAFSPWVLLRLIPLAEVAAAAVGHIRGQVHTAAGVRTPEAALASRAAAKVASRNRNGAGGASDLAAGMAAGGGVPELLEQMQRRAQAAQPGSPGPAEPSRPSTPAGHGDGHEGQADSRSHAGGLESTGLPTSALGRGREQTMVQRPDGSWEPRARPESPAAMPSAPWEDPEPSGPVSQHEAASPPLPGPPDGRLFGDDEDAT